MRETKFLIIHYESGRFLRCADAQEVLGTYKVLSQLPRSEVDMIDLVSGKVVTDHFVLKDGALIYNPIEEARAG